MKIKKLVEKLSEAYSQLVAANNDFVNKKSGAENFDLLIEARGHIASQIEEVANSLIKETKHKFIGHSFSCNSISEVMLALPVLDPEMHEHCQKVKENLKKLIESDKKVEELVAKQRDDCRAEIAKIRKGSKSIRGYRQGNSSASAFIDKTK